MADLERALHRLRVITSTYNVHYHMIFFEGIESVCRRMCGYLAIFRKYTKLQGTGQNRSFGASGETNIKLIHKPYDTELHSQNHKS